MAEQKQYCGSGKKSPNHDIVNIVIMADQLGEVHEYKGKKFYKFCVGAKRETDQYGKTHSVWVDTFVPDSNRAQNSTQSQSAPIQPPTDEIDPDDIPF